MDQTPHSETGTPAAGQAPTEERPGLWRRRAIRALTVGILGSLLLHALFWILATSIWIGGGSRGTGSNVIQIEMAIAPDVELSNATLEELSLDSMEVPEQAPDVVAESLLDEVIEIDPEALETGTESLDSSIETGGGDIGEGNGLDGGGSGGGTSFFGIEAQGNRFAYIVDISGSMAFGGKIQSTAKELTSSINKLNSNARFVVVFYNGQAFPLGARKKWTRAAKSGKSWAKKKLADVQVGGATNPYPAFQVVFEISPLPDAIYFMTDGEFPDDIGERILDILEDTNIPVHAITFGNRSQVAGQMMRRIAKQTGGTYTHVNSNRGGG